MWKYNSIGNLYWFKNKIKINEIMIFQSQFCILMQDHIVCTPNGNEYILLNRMVIPTRLIFFAYTNECCISLQLFNSSQIND